MLNQEQGQNGSCESQGLFFKSLFIFFFPE